MFASSPLFSFPDGVVELQNPKISVVQIALSLLLEQRTTVPPAAIVKSDERQCVGCEDSIKKYVGVYLNKFYFKK